MADPRSIIVLDSTGAPLTSGTPSVQAFDRTTGASRTAPSFAHVAAAPGTWRFTVTDTDETVGTVVLVDFGAGNLPRFAAFPCFKADNSNQFWTVPIVGADGSAWSGAAPTWGGYSTGAGPAFTAMSGAATATYATAPSAGDISTGAEGRIDGPAGSAQPYWNVSTEPTTSSPWAAPSPGPLKNPAIDVVNFLDTKVAGAVTLAKGTNLFAGPVRSVERIASPAVFALNTGGAAPEPYLSSTREGYYRAGVQLMVRGAASDVEAGETMARAVMAWLHQYQVTGYVSVYAQQAQPNYLGEDSNQHPLWSINLVCEFKAALG